MKNSRNILLLPGDGIGIEVAAEVEKLIGWLNAQGLTSFETEKGLIGGCAYDAHGHPLPQETLKLADQADAILLGAVGGPKWEPLDISVRPEKGLLGIRKHLDLFANLRPAIAFPALAEASTLKREVVEGLDILIVRELTGGLYFGQPRGIEKLPDGSRKGVNTLVYTTEEIRRVAKVAFELAAKRGKKLCSVDKANVLECTELWREEVTKLGNETYPGIQLSHMYVDNASMQLVRNPKQFDVIVTENTFGDILSDTAAMLTGSLGMLPSASLGSEKNGRTPALYEPVHGSAPDIAGKGVANPLATILSFAMMLNYSFDMAKEASLIEKAVSEVLEKGIRTADIWQEGARKVSTSEMGDAVISTLGKLAEKAAA